MDEDHKFQQAIEVVLDHEGGFVDDPDDPGGATNWGISLRFLKSLGELDLDEDGFTDFDLDRDGDVDADDIRMFTREHAKAVYFQHWWERHGYQHLPLVIGTKIFDHAVNMGSRPTHRCVQRALRACREPVVDDGIIGPKTLNALARPLPDILLPAICSEVAGHYRLLISRRPKFEKYRNGWLRRAYHHPFLPEVI